MPPFCFEMGHVLNNSHLTNEVVLSYEYTLYAECMPVFIAEHIINTVKMPISYASHYTFLESHEGPVIWKRGLYFCVVKS